MPRSARFSRQSSMPLFVAMAAFVLGAFVQLWLARPYALGGILLDRDLQIASGSTLPSDLLQIGDRLVGVDPDGSVGATGVIFLTERDEVALRVAGAPGPSITVSIERQGSVERIELSAGDLDGELPVSLRGTWTVERIDGQPVSGTIGLDELRFLAAQSAPRPLQVDVRVGGRVQGPVEIQRVRPDMLGGAWLVVTLLGVLGVLLGSKRSARSLLPAELLRLASLLAGGLAAGAAASALVDGLSPVWVGVWYVALAGLARAVALTGHLHALSDDPDAPPGLERAAGVLVLPGLFALACPAAVWFALQPGATAPLRTLGQLEAAGLALFAAYLVADAVLLVRMRSVAPRGALAGVLLALGVAVVGAGALVLPQPIDFSSLAAATVLAAVAAGWAGDLFDSVQTDGQFQRRSRTDQVESGAVQVLARVAAIAGQRSVALAVGSAGEFVLVTGVDRTGGGIDATQVRRAPSTLADALSMLSTEGGMFPRAEGDAELDAFAGLAERVGLAVAIPLRPAGDGASLDVFLIVLDDADDPMPDPAAIAWELDGCDTQVLYVELGVLASAELIAEARRRAAHDDDGARATPAPGAKAPAPVPVPAPVVVHAPTVAVGNASERSMARWAEWLESRLATEFPVDDPEALTPDERRALVSYANSDGAVLLLGEPGVGKEFIARAIHDASSRRSERFVVVDCSLLPPAVVEFELFGDDEVPGLVELVGRGSLLLKSASSLPASVLDGVLSRLDRAGGRLFVAERYRGPDPGVPDSVPASIRRRVEKRTLHLAPLRDRTEDLPRLARWFLHREAMRYDFVAGAHERAVELGDDAIAALSGLTLPGNFRELRAVVSSALLRCEGDTIGRCDIGDTTAPTAAAPVARSKAVEPSAEPATSAVVGDEDEGGGDLDRSAIIAALRACHGNRTVAAQKLGVTRGKLLRQMKKLGIQ